MTKRALLVTPLVAATVLCGCSGGSTIASTSLGSALRAGPGVSAGPAPKRQRVVFVANLGDAVSYFSANLRAQNPPLLGEITQGVTRAQGLCVDSRGTLYVMNNTQPSSIAEYHRGSSTPFTTITSGLYTPTALTVGNAGSLYVADGESGGVVLVYPRGASAPSQTIQLPQQGHSAIGGIALDNHGDILVATFDVEHSIGNVYSIAPGSNQPVNLNLQNLPGNALGTDKAGNIYVGGVEGGIAVFTPGSQTPVRAIDAGATGFYSDFTVTSNGTIYWPNYERGGMYEFAPGASSPTNVFSGGGGVDAAVGLW